MIVITRTCTHTHKHTRPPLRAHTCARTHARTHLGCGAAAVPDEVLQAEREPCARPRLLKRDARQEARVRQRRRRGGRALRQPPPGARPADIGGRGGNGSGGGGGCGGSGSGRLCGGGGCRTQRAACWRRCHRRGRRAHTARSIREPPAVLGGSFPPKGVAQQRLVVNVRRRSDGCQRNNRTIVAAPVRVEHGLHIGARQRERELRPRPQLLCHEHEQRGVVGGQQRGSVGARRCNCRDGVRLSRARAERRHAAGAQSRPANLSVRCRGRDVPSGAVSPVDSAHQPRACALQEDHEPGDGPTRVAVTAAVEGGGRGQE
eukprot:46802-Chlamydomonas_euryale.AAC.3